MRAWIVAFAFVLLAAAPVDAASGSVTGKATWYVWHPGQAAAGPALRAALGKNWRGAYVRACTATRCVRVRLTDWCACPGGRVIDLDVRAFATLAAPSRGVIRVKVRWP